MTSFLVTGATGQQGGAVVTHLLAAGAKVHAVVRNSSSPKAIALSEKGVVLFEGTHEEPDAAFRAAAKGISGIFLNLSMFEPGKAQAQAEAVIQASKAGGGATLKSIVLSSTSRTAEMTADLAAAEKIHPWLGQYYTAKSEVEAAVRESGIQHHTILRPPVLDSHFLLPNSASYGGCPELPKSGRLVTSLEHGGTMPYLDPDDIGKFAAAALLDPAKFSGHEFDLASDNLTALEVRDILARVSGIGIKFHKRTPAEMEQVSQTVLFQAFEMLANSVPRSVDVEAVEKKYGIKFTKLAEYMDNNKNKLIDSLPLRSLAAV